jgi:hypothetical protein
MESASRQLIKAEHDLDYALQWGDMVGVRKAAARVEELEKAVRREHGEWAMEQLRSLFATLNPLSREQK